MIIVFIDGRCAPSNPGGIGTVGVVVIRNDQVIEFSAYVGRGPSMSNNVAEYEALHEALTFLIGRGWNNEETLIRGDSELVIEQMSGRRKVRKGLYKHVQEYCQYLVNSHFPNIRFEWITGDLNYRADRLAEDEYDKVTSQ